MSAFWNFVTRFVPGNLAKAEEVNTNLDGVNTGFNLVEAEINKAIQVTDNPGVTDIGLNAAARANKLLSFDVNGDIAATTIIGDWKGDHADAAGTDYEIRDVVKDAAGSLGQDNIYICTNTHTSTGSLLTDTANWDLVLDAVAAANSAAAALASENAAAATYDLFDDRMLGAFNDAGEPTLDNDGDALVTGAMYFNTTINRWKVYNGSAWQIISAAAVDVTISDAGAIYTSVDVEAALQEVMTGLNTQISTYNAHNHTLDGLSNTTITANASGEILMWNGSAWINRTLAEAGIATASHQHTSFDRSSSVLSGANVFSNLVVVNGIVTAIATRALTIANLGITATESEVSYTTDVTSNIQAQLNAKAALASPALTGNPTAPTQTVGNNSTRMATTAFVTTAVANGQQFHLLEPPVLIHNQSWSAQITTGSLDVETLLGISDIQGVILSIDVPHTSGVITLAYSSAPTTYTDRNDRAVLSDGDSNVSTTVKVSSGGLIYFGVNSTGSAGVYTSVKGYWK